VPGNPKFMSVVSVDANVLVWMFREGHYKNAGTLASAELAELQKRSDILLQDLNRRAVKVILSTMVVSEYLAGIEEKRQADALGSLRSSFEIYSFDLPSCLLAARLWQARPQATTGVPGQRVAMKADVMAVATAKVHGATEFYSHDANCRKVAESAGMVARDLPTHSEFLPIDIGPPDKPKKKPNQHKP
jgi:predicted nucleic acid-binding protein